MTTRTADTTATPAAFDRNSPEFRKAVADEMARLRAQEASGVRSETTADQARASAIVKRMEDAKAGERAGTVFTQADAYAFLMEMESAAEADANAMAPCGVVRAIGGRRPHPEGEDGFPITSMGDRLVSLNPNWHGWERDDRGRLNPNARVRLR